VPRLIAVNSRTSGFAGVSDANVSRETFACFGKASVNAGVKGESVSRETFLLGRESSGEKNTEQFVNEELRFTVSGAD
jgi:hypothetical protein